MAIINCRECGKEVSDLAEKCPNCGAPIRIVQPVSQTTSSPLKNKNSKLGIIALIFSILGCSFIFGIILAIIDLCQKDGRKKTLSIIALIICGIWTIGITANSNNGDTNNSSNNNVTIEEQKTEPSIEPKEEIQYISYTVNEMMDDLNNNPLSASDKYKGQYIEITGRLAVIDSSGKYIALYPDDEWTISGVHCNLARNNEEQRQAVASMSIGSEITLRGKCKDVGEIMGYTLDIDSIN